MPKSIPAPKKDMPSHAESYNPSKEYLFDKEEEEREALEEEEDRMYNFVPTAYDSLRKVPLYQDLIKESFE